VNLAMEDLSFGTPFRANLIFKRNRTLNKYL
jgi:hypothetical protein